MPWTEAKWIVSLGWMKFYTHLICSLACCVWWASVNVLLAIVSSSSSSADFVALSFGQVRQLTYARSRTHSHNTYGASVVCERRSEEEAIRIADNLCTNSSLVSRIQFIIFVLIRMCCTFLWTESVIVCVCVCVFSLSLRGLCSALRTRSKRRYFTHTTAIQKKKRNEMQLPVRWR